MDFKPLISGCLDGDRRAQKMMFDHFAGKMLYLCQRYAASTMEAEDMLQEGFLRLYSNLHQYKFEGSFEGWVRRVFVNTAIKQYHKVQKHNGHAQLEMAWRHSVDAEAVSKISQDEMMEVVKELPQGYRTVFNLYAIEGYNHKEIAGMLEIQESTSRSQLVKARKLLQTKITELQKIYI